jgi:AcrR family transcriptional regulator
MCSGAAPTPSFLQSQASLQSQAPALSTRHRLLDVAGEFFAQAGYQHATVRNICAKAHSNIASINYHFGDKAALYREVVRHAARLVQASSIAKLPSEASAAQRLGMLIERLVTLFAGETPSQDSAGTMPPRWAGILLQRELSEPTHAIEDATTLFLRPIRDELCRLIALALETAPHDDQVSLFADRVLAACVWHRPSWVAKTPTSHRVSIRTFCMRAVLGDADPTQPTGKFPTTSIDSME